VLTSLPWYNENMKKPYIFGSILVFVVVLIGVVRVQPVEAFLFFKNIHKESGVAAAAATDPAASQACALYARIKFSNNPGTNFGVRNWGTGNLARKSYVGSNNDGSIYASGAWFPLYQNRHFIVDHPIDSYEDVKGLAVQRLNGAVRIVLHGSWEEPDGAPLTNRERATATLEFSENAKDRSTTVVPTSWVSDSEHQVDYEPGHGVNEPQDDQVKIVNNQVQFKMVVNTNDDGFYTYYTFTPPAGCK
jgi:hypothetical protein